MNTLLESGVSVRNLYQCRLRNIPAPDANPRAFESLVLWPVRSRNRQPVVQNSGSTVLKERTAGRWPDATGSHNARTLGFGPQP